MISKEEALQKITLLVQRFNEQKEFYKNSDYNETLTRRDFIDPFFKALNWDVDNERGYSESYREVIHEDKIKIGKATKAPDYSFRLGGGKRLFFVEAKKPSIAIKDDIVPAYQVRRYGWSAKLAVSIVTDFEELAVYDCTKKPFVSDKAATSRIKYITYDKYLSDFDFLWETFSKEQVLKGSFDKYVKSDKNKKGTTTVDYEFLISLDTWRTFLANNIALRNNIDEDELNFAVQQIIDRIIFLRIAEDRGVETAESLKECTTHGDYYKNMLQLFHTSDQKYNSGLFDFTKDKTTGNIEIDNKVIKSIITDLYYPSPYAFDVIPVEILGSAYEQFLGKQITLSKSGRAVIDEKPEVRKAGGVYYTPQYIVEYIVNNTVGKLIKGKTPKEISKLKIVDPACGSGSFLIGAYQCLLDYHKDYYTKNGKPSKGSKDNPLTPDGNLVTAEKKNILLNNIYGVDLDTNAVEVTKLSLLLKCMEGETKASIESQTKLFHERILPTLDSNIKTGNSLIDTDFYSNELDFGEEKKIKPFNWQKGFPEVFKQGGFDCVIGNPPYGASFGSNETVYFLKKYKLQNYQLDSYFLFIEKSFQILKTKGSLGYIIPNTWLLNLKSSKIREHLFSTVTLANIVHYQIPVFVQAVVDTEIMIFLNYKPSKEHQIKVLIYDKKNALTEKVINQQLWIKLKGKPVNIFDTEESNTIKSKIIQFPILDTLCKITQGTKPFQVGKGKPSQTKKILEEKLFVSEIKKDSSFRPLLRGSLMNRYKINWNNNYWIMFGDWLAEPRYSADYEATEKIIIRQTGDYLNATLDTKQFIVRDNLYTIVPKSNEVNLKFILGLINSKFLSWYYQNIINPEKGEALAQVKRGHIAALPIAIATKAEETEIIKFVDQLLKLNEEIATTTLASTREQIQSRINYCEDKVNEIVYKLYNLTQDEINIIEAI